jgi:3-dehydroquinate synthetase
VALGMIAAADMSAALGYCDRTLPVRIRRIVERLGLPEEIAFEPEEVLKAMGADKKRRGGEHRFVVPTRIGQVEVVSNVPTETVLAALDTIKARPLGEANV